MKICGMDECGRGAFAGPLVAAAVIIKGDLETFVSSLPLALRDSKKLTEIQRNKIYNLRHRMPIQYQIEEVSVADINEYGMGWANKVIFERLIAKIKATIYIVDGNLKFSNPSVKTLIKGDDKCYQVMLASILAKVHRDSLMSKLHHSHPDYRWDLNSGYGTKHHLTVIKSTGITLHHRTKFVDTYLKKH